MPTEKTAALKPLKLSANLGFLWPELQLPEAIQAAAQSGFDAVECHWPYTYAAKDIKQALEQTGLPMLSLNTAPGDLQLNEFGLNALPGREQQARDLIDQAVEYAAATGTGCIHLMAGVSEPNSASTDCFLLNMEYATQEAANHGITILIEPINHKDVPGYYLTRFEQARDLVLASGAANLKILFDCYHLQIMQGNLAQLFKQHVDLIGHVQFAAVPSRTEPDEGELAYAPLLKGFVDCGYRGYFGAEYRPRGLTRDGLTWMTRIQCPPTS